MEQPLQGLEADEAKHRLLNHWLLWGVLPVPIFFIITLAVARFAPHAGLSEVKSASRFEGFLAAAAGLFLAAFWADGRLTSPERLLRFVRNPGDGEGDEGSKQRRHKLDAQERTLIRERVVRVADWLVLVGMGIGATAVAAGWYLPSGKPYYGLQIVAVAAIYQLFIFSRHGFYFDLIDGKALVVEPDKKRKHDAGKPEGGRRKGRKGKAG